MNNAPSFTPVDFDALVKRMKTDGAFDDYPKPLGTTNAASVGQGFHNPRFPGDRSYGLGARQIKEGVANIPQDLVDAQNTSTKDAIKHYMPDEQIGKWMHEYFTGDFMGSKSFRKHVSDIHHIQYQPFAMLEGQHTMKLDAKERHRDDRKMFTPEELALALEVSKKQPALAIAVMGYQTSFIGYLDKLEGAIGRSTELDKKQRKNGKEAVHWLRDLWRNASFYSVILPAVATHYVQNHNGNMDEKLTQKDFNDGMQFISRNGAFHQVVPYADNSGQVDVKCSAHRILNKTSAIAIGDGAEAPDAHSPMVPQLGTALFHIYREVDKTIKPDSKALQRTQSDLQRIIEVSVPHRGWKNWF